MQSTFTYVPYLWLYIVSTVVLLMFMAAQLPRIHLPLAKRILWVLFAAFLWNFFLILEFMVSTIELKLFYAKTSISASSGCRLHGSLRSGAVILPVQQTALHRFIDSARRFSSSFFRSSAERLWGIPTIETTSSFR